MPTNYSCLLILIMSVSNFAASFGQTTNSLEQYKWKNRLVIVNTGSDLAQEQIRLFQQAQTEWEDRDLLLIQLVESKVYLDSKPVTHLNSDVIKNDLGIGESFECILIGKDGSIKQRSKIIKSPEYFFDIIDQMPMQQGEIQKSN